MYNKTLMNAKFSKTFTDRFINFFYMFYHVFLIKPIRL